MMENNNLPLLVALGIGIYFFSQRKPTGSKRQALTDWATGDASAAEIFQVMTDTEIDATYDYVFNYILRNLSVDPASRLGVQIQVIANKYNIFT